MTDIIPQFLYHYRGCPAPKKLDDKLKSIIKDNQLWSACPLTFNDPFDCIPQFKMPITYNDVLEYIKHHIKNGSIKNINRHTNREYAVKRAKSFFKNKEEILSCIQGGWEKSIKTIGITCFSEEKSNILLWSHYASQHQGICFEFCFQGQINLSKNTFQVDYSDKRPELDFFGDYLKFQQISRETIHKILTNKASEWSYEKEWRLMERLRGQDIGKGKKITFPKNMITKIIIGCKATPELEKETKEFLDANGLDIPVVRASLDEKEYRINVP